MEVIFGDSEDYGWWLEVPGCRDGQRQLRGGGRLAGNH